MSRVYWRVFQDRDLKIWFVCMQDFDERDYNQDRFLTNLKFDTEEAAIAWYDEAVTKSLRIALGLRN